MTVYWYTWERNESMESTKTQTKVPRNTAQSSKQKIFPRISRKPTFRARWTAWWYWPNEALYLARNVGSLLMFWKFFFLTALRLISPLLLSCLIVSKRFYEILQYAGCPNRADTVNRSITVHSTERCLRNKSLFIKESFI